MKRVQFYALLTVIFMAAIGFFPGTAAGMGRRQAGEMDSLHPLRQRVLRRQGRRLDRRPHQGEKRGSPRGRALLRRIARLQDARISQGHQGRSDRHGGVLLAACHGNGADFRGRRPAVHVFLLRRFPEFARKVLVPNLSTVAETKWNMKLIGIVMYPQTAFYGKKSIRPRTTSRGSRCGSWASSTRTFSRNSAPSPPTSPSKTLHRPAARRRTGDAQQPDGCGGHQGLGGVRATPA